MKRKIRKIEGDIVQITTLDERWYTFEEVYEDKDVKLEEGEFFPSSSWIADHYPKGIGFYKWLAKHGWDESQRLKMEAGAEGSTVHQAIERLLSGEEVTLESEFKNPETERIEEITETEYASLVSFVGWYDRFNPDVIAVERSFINTKYRYGGTIDLIWELHEPVKVYRTTYEPGLYVTDHKTSSNIYPSHRIQLSSYKRGLPAIDDVMEELDERGLEWSKANLTLLQVGYSRNKRGWKLTLVPDKFDLFLAARRIWKEENEETQPSQVEYPVSLELKNN